METAEWLSLASAVVGLAGFGITTWDLLPEYRLHRARVALARASLLLRREYGEAKGDRQRAGKLSPSDLSRNFELAEAQFASQIIRERGLTDTVANEINAALDEAEKIVGKAEFGSVMVFKISDYGRIPDGDDFVRELKAMVPEVRRYFDIEQPFRVREGRLPTRQRSLELGLGLVAVGFVLQALASLF